MSKRSVTAREIRLEIINLSIRAKNLIVTKIGKQDRRWAELYGLGFTNVEKARKIGDLLRDNNAKKKKIKLIQYYKRHYPQHPFIDEDILKHICIKYDLITGDSGTYCGDIPEESKNRIVDFSVKDKDCEVHAIRMGSYGGGSWEDSEQKVKMFMVVAPAHLFKMTGKRLEGHKIVNKDPIVIHPVKGGYLVVTNWE